MIGETLAHFRITAKLGEGGMGEVYRAEDTRLGREVAIKVLPEALAGDAERMTRFEREARILAQLDHPGIAAIYGLERAAPATGSGTARQLLVMQLIEGETLEDRMARAAGAAATTTGGAAATREALSIESVLDIAAQIAEAMEAAHDRGIIHRDLKPANVKITPGGQVKLLDFGLARALESAPQHGSGGDPMHSPTLTSAGTAVGMILGTAAYMSPEQAAGQPVDRRCDIWSFGVVLFEMLSGQRMFRGETVSHTLADVLRAELDWSTLPTDTPPAVVQLLKRCLERDAKQRLRDIGEARILLREVLADPAKLAGGATAGPSVDVSAPAPSGLRPWIAIAAVVVTAVASAAIVRSLGPTPPEPPLRKFEIRRGDFRTDEEFAAGISPDGRSVVFTQGETLWIRELDRIGERELAGTEGARFATWSPDGEFLVYAKDGALWKVPAQGGESTTVAVGAGQIGLSGGISWGPDGRIVFATGGSGISEVSARGGDPRVLVKPAEKTESDLHEPHFLPDDHGILYVVHRLETAPDTIAVWKDGVTKVILQLDNQPLRTPVYSPTGHLLYRRVATQAGLWAVPFDLSRLETAGEPFLIDPKGMSPTVSSDGSLLYVHGAGSGLKQLVWVNRDGVIEGPIGQAQSGIAAPAVSPDGTRVAVMGLENENWDIWIHDAARGTRTRLTFGAKMDWDPAWTPDGDRVVYWDGDTRDLSWKPADGTGQAERLIDEDLPDSGVPAISPDGELMVFWAKPETGVEDVWISKLSDRTTKPLLSSPAAEDYPRLSPDGRYLAYSSDESGRSEVYLTRFPSGEGKWQVSVDGGAIPVWDRDGSSILYLGGDSVMEVAVATEPALRLGTPRKLFSAQEIGVEIYGMTRFDVAPDGRLVMVRELEQDGVRPSLLLVESWVAEFRQDVD